jgi:hypothetical protein
MPRVYDGDTPDKVERTKEEAQQRMLTLTSDNGYQVLANFVDVKGGFTYPDRVKALIRSIYNERNPADIQ